MKAVRIQEPGGPEAMKLEELPTPVPGPGQALVRVEASGVNFIDTYHRSGAYKVPLPTALGQEGAGVVETIGPGVTEVKVGDRVAWTNLLGSYTTHMVLPSDRLVTLPDGISTQQAAAAMLQGMTAHYLSCSMMPLGPNDACLVHAAAGGVGALLCQLLKRRGVRVIGTVSTEEKAEIAHEAGADQIIFYTKQDFEEETKRLTDGKGVTVVYDGVGKDTFEKSINSLKPRGYMVLFGQSSGAVSSFDPQVLNARGSLWLTRPSLMHYVATREELVERAGEVLGWIASGQLRLRIDRTYPLEEAAAAHRALSGRETMGKILLIP